MTELKYIGETFSRFIFEIKDGDTLLGYGALVKAHPSDIRKLLEDEEEVPECERTVNQRKR